MGSFSSMDKHKMQQLTGTYKTEVMCKKDIAMIHVVVLSIFNMLIFPICVCLRGHAFDSAFELDQDKDTTIQKHVAMIHVVVLLQITLFLSLCGVHG
jgi:hypothetical protein